MDLQAIEGVVKYFRPMGFFRSLGRATPRAIATELAAIDDTWIGKLTEYSVDPEEPRCFSDLVVLALDRSRVWRLESWEVLLDPYAREQGYAYCKSYAQVLENLARIASHAFALSCTQSRRGTMTLSFARKKHAIRFDVDGGVLSTDFLAKVNEVIAPSGHEYVFVSSRFCNGYIVLLEHAQKRKLASKRQWQYYPA